MSHNLPPMPPDVTRLLDEERARPAPDAAALARVKSRLLASVVAGAVVDLPHSPSWTRVFSWTRVAGSSAVLGLVVGAAWIVQPPAERPVPVVALPVKESVVPVVREPVATPVAEPVAVVEEPAAPEPAPVRRKETRAAPVRRQVVQQEPAAVEEPVVEPAREELPAQDPAEEHLLLERARMNLQAQRLDDARRALEEHARRFPSGRLVEERQALEVVVLARGGNTEEAQRAAAAFRAAHRRSLFQPMIDQALNR